MNLVIPMAGRGKRLRPHTLTTPKPLVPIAGKPIVERLVLDIAEVCEEKIESIAFIIGDFGEEVEQSLLAIAESIEAAGKIVYQEEALGTAHAIFCAKDFLKGKVIVAFADTLFKANFTLDSAADGIVWVMKVKDPSAFGVIKVDDNDVITDFVEKPQEFVSDKAIIGIYYFRDGEKLRNEIQYLMDNKITSGGEYQLTEALENMKTKGIKFKPGEVQEWLDCGNKNATVDTNSRYLMFLAEEELVNETAELTNCVIVPPVFIGKNVSLRNVVLGPGVSVGANAKISDSVLKHSIVGENSEIYGAVLSNSMIGKYVKYNDRLTDVSLGDYNEVEV